MALTKDELKAKMRPKLFQKHRAELTWAELVSAIQDLTVDQKASLVSAFSRGQGKRAGEGMQKAVDNAMRVAADAEADAMLVNDSLDMTELDRIYG